MWPNHRATNVIKRRNFWLPLSEFSRLRRRSLIAANDGLREICGYFVCGPDGQVRLTFTLNRTAEPSRFKMRKADLGVCPTRRQVWGTFHSHPLGEEYPSETEANLSNFSPLLMIYSDIFEKIALWGYFRSRTPVRLNLRVRR
ncbi:Mov34/MPN/PAD-1 family protein [Candidatus Rhodobacter oscarellae]|uniref:Mov34/MPN/PAD-1 family protein n=1 Tax=Candidatus Rhodobacter oscarellae TaxID=1675527 RepID=UPI00128F637C